MASSILKNLKNKNVSGALGNGNIFTKFSQFREEILASGKDPMQILNELVASGKINQNQLNQAKRLAGLYRGKFGV